MSTQPPVNHGADDAQRGPGSALAAPSALTEKHVFEFLAQCYLVAVKAALEQAGRSASYEYAERWDGLAERWSGCATTYAEAACAASDASAADTASGSAAGRADAQSDANSVQPNEENHG